MSKVCEDCFSKEPLFDLSIGYFLGEPKSSSRRTKIVLPENVDCVLGEP